eukprot:g7827.t1
MDVFARISSALEEAAQLVGASTALERELSDTICAARRAHEVQASLCIAWPSFEQSMSSCASRPMRWGLWHEGDRDWYASLQARYDRVRSTREACIQNAGGCAAKPGHIPRPPRRARSIPRVIHHIWLGSPLPARFRALRETWRAYHPTWRHVLWGDAEAAAFGLRNRAAFDAAPNWGEKSDLLRYEVLLRHGGVYVDTDFECVRALDELVELGLGFFAGISNTASVELNNGLVGAAPGHPLLARLVRCAGAGTGDAGGGTGGAEAVTRAARARQAAALSLLGGSGLLQPAAGAAAAAGAAVIAGGAGGRLGTVERTGPGLFTRAFMEEARRSGRHGSGGAGAGAGEYGGGDAGGSDAGCVAFPCSFFYPMPNDAPPVPDSARQYAQPDTFAVHHYARSWQQ